MRFEVLLESDAQAGRQGPDAAAVQPCDGAVWNRFANRWELEIKSLEQLEEICREVDAFVLVGFPLGLERERGDLPLLAVQDGRSE